MSRLSQEGDAKRVIELCVSEQDAFDRDVSHRRRRNVAGRQAADLLADVRRRVEEKPPVPIAAYGDGRLSARPGGLWIDSSDSTAGTPTVPLRKAATGSTPQKGDVHSSEKKWRSSDELRLKADYRRAAYAVTSSVTATSLNSGFVQVMRPPIGVQRKHGIADVSSWQLEIP